MTDAQERKYEYSADFHVVKQMKSWMAVNPSFGCAWDCAYCVQHKDRFYDIPDHKRIHKVKFGNDSCTPEEVVAELITSPKITPRTPLIFYNFSDPFLPQNTGELEKILTLLDKRRFTNIVGLITRTFVGTDTLDTLANLNNLRLVVMISYAGYNNQKIESGPLQQRVSLAKELKKRNIKTIQYLRPIAREWIEPDQFERARDAIGHLVDGVVMSGVRLTPEITARIRARGLPVPYTPNYTNKFFPKDIQEMILETYRDAAPVYRYTSCAVSSVLRIPDYNAHWDFLRETQSNTFPSCPVPCKQGQSELCSSTKPVSNEEFRLLLRKINLDNVTFTIKPSGVIIVDRELSKEDLSFLRHNTSHHVDCEQHHHHVDQIAHMTITSEK